MFFKTFWLVPHRLIGTFNLFIFLTYTLLTLVTVSYSLIAMINLLFDQKLDMLIFGLVLLIVAVIVNLGMYKYISWFHNKGIYLYIDYDKKHFGGTFLRELIPMIKEM